MQSMVLAAAFMIVSSTGYAGLVSSIKPPGEFSPPTVHLEIENADWIDGATVSFYHRKIIDGRPSAWDLLPEASHLSATQAVYGGTHGETLEFRSALNLGAQSECVVFSNFDDPLDYLLVGYIGSEFGYRCDYSFNGAKKMQGLTSMFMTYSCPFDEMSKLPKNAMVGFPLTSTIPTRDWSKHNFFEFYLWHDTEKPANFFLQSASQELQKPVMDFSIDGTEPKAWHKIEIDLDKEFGPAADRTMINVCALAIPVDENTPLKTKYQIGLDSMKLWSSQNWVRTTIDSTPPPAPDQLARKPALLGMEWTWECGDPESGIEGYSYSWGKDNRKEPDEAIDTEKTSVKIPFAKPPRYATYYFKVKAKNRAGQWSEIASEPVIFDPSKK